MSFDFSKIAELSTARGKLVELKNSAGRVIWAVKSGGGRTFYLRPSADISVDEGLTLYPGESTPAYLRISEEVSDGDSTYICSSGETGFGFARFNLGGVVPNRINKVTNVYLVVSAHGIASTSKPTVISYLTLNGMEYCCGMSDGGFTDDDAHYFSGEEYIEGEFNYFYEASIADNSVLSATPTDLCAVMNEYVAENGMIPDMELHIYMSRATGYDATNTKNPYSYYSLYLSQAYLVIECE